MQNQWDDPNYCYFLLGKEIPDCMHLVERYLNAARLQHARFLDKLPKQQPEKEAYELALVELHFYLVSVNRVIQCAKLVGETLGTDIQSFVTDNIQTHSDHIDARNHFEHLEDRAHGSGRNKPQPVQDDHGNERIIYFGIFGARPDLELRFGQKSIDISPKFQAHLDKTIADFETLLMRHAASLYKAKEKPE